MMYYNYIYLHVCAWSYEWNICVHICRLQKLASAFFLSCSPRWLLRLGLLLNAELTDSIYCSYPASPGQPLSPSAGITAGPPPPLDCFIWMLETSCFAKSILSIELSPRPNNILLKREWWQWKYTTRLLEHGQLASEELAHPLLPFRMLLSGYFPLLCKKKRTLKPKSHWGTDPRSLQQQSCDLNSGPRSIWSTVIVSWKGPGSW